MTGVIITSFQKIMAVILYFFFFNGVNILSLVFQVVHVYRKCLFLEGKECFFYWCFAF